MARTPMWRRYVRFWGSDVRADVDAELDFHVRELTERLVRQGRDPVEARAEAERRFGDYGRVRTACVDIDRGWERQRRWRQLVADLWQDLRIGARTLAKNPGFTIAAVVVLGLGLGAATVTVSVINAVFVRPLPFPEPDRIFNVVGYGDGPGPATFHSQAAVALARDHSRAFSALAGIRETPGVNLAGDRGSAYVRSLMVTAGFFRVFGVEPRLGRSFLRDDETDPSTVVLSHAVWAGQFDSDPNIVGQTVRLGGRPHAVIGIMPAEFRSYEEADAWTPFRPDPGRMDQNYRLIGRLAPGWTAAQAEAELQALAVSLRDRLPVPAAPPGAPPVDPRPGVQPYRDTLAANSGGMIWPLTAAAGVMLLVVLRQRGGAAAGARGGTPAGARRPLRARRGPRPPGPAASDRVRPVVGGGRRAGDAGRRRGGARTRRDPAGARGLGPRSRCAGASRVPRHRPRHRRVVRPAARAASDPRRAGGRPPWRPVAQHDHGARLLDARVARGRPGRPVHDAACRGGCVPADLRRAQLVGARLRARQRAHRPRLAAGPRLRVRGRRVGALSADAGRAGAGACSPSSCCGA